MHILEIITCSYIRQKIVLYMCVMLRVADLCFVLMLLRDFKFARDAFHVGATMASSGSGSANLWLRLWQCLRRYVVIWVSDSQSGVPQHACSTCGRAWPPFREPWRGSFCRDADTRAGEYCRTVTYCDPSCTHQQWFCEISKCRAFMREQGRSYAEIREFQIAAHALGF